MMASKPAKKPDKTVIAAWSAHIFTALGASAGCMALLHVSMGDPKGAFLWLGLTLFIDGIDGTLARKARVSEVLPQFDGATVDNIIDYMTYVIIPAFIVYWEGLAPGNWSIIAPVIMATVSVYHFGDEGHKTKDWYFKGFPALWNVVVFYLVMMHMPLAANLAIILVCAACTFVPIKVVHPMRVAFLRRTNILATVIWSVGSLLMLVLYPSIPLYAYALSLGGLGILALTSLRRTLMGEDKELA